jgi:hypothetical protein
MVAAVFVASPGFLVISLALLALGIWVAVDASKYPDWAFQRANTQKWIYQVLAPIGGLFCGIIAIVVGIIWFSSKKAEVAAAASSGGGAPEGTYGTSLPPSAPTWGPGAPPPAAGTPPPAAGTWTPPPPPPSGPATPPPPGPAFPPPPDDPPAT